MSVKIECAIRTCCLSVHDNHRVSAVAGFLGVNITDKGVYGGLNHRGGALCNVLSRLKISLSRMLRIMLCDYLDNLTNCEKSNIHKVFIVIKALITEL